MRERRNQSKILAVLANSESCRAQRGWRRAAARNCKARVALIDIALESRMSSPRPIGSAMPRRRQTMAAQRTTDEADIRQRIDRLAAAIRAMDLDAVMPIYAADLVSFDIVAPLRHVGAAAKRKNWIAAFAMYRRPLDYEIRDLTIIMGGDVAFGHSLNRIGGTLKAGGRNELWLRWTTGFRKIDGNWLIVHDHVSVPADFASGAALLNLAPT
jgi:ketosteroid isomerase-like protein